MLKKTLVSLAALAAVAAAPAPAGADSLAVPGASAQALTVLRGTIVWVSGHKLMQRRSDGTVRRVRGTPFASYRSIDLGLNGSGEQVLTYLRCPSDDTNIGCRAYSDDLHGKRTSFKRLAPPGCQLSAAPSRWRGRVAYGLRCSTRNGTEVAFDARRSGLFVREGAGRPRRLQVPPADADTGFTVTQVELRGRNVGASVDAGSTSYAIAQTINARGRQLTEIASRCPGPCDGAEPEELASQAHVHSVALGGDRDMWALVGTPMTLSYMDETICYREALPDQRQTTGAGPARAMARDGETLYLAIPNKGIVTHRFAPQGACD